jgi:hypothetical protein
MNMNIKYLFYLLSLFSISCALKIRIPSGNSSFPSAVSPQHPLPIMDNQFHLIKTCDTITPQLTGADLLAYYTQDFYNGLTSFHSELVIVRHEIQRMAHFSTHRIIYKMQGSSGNVMYVALKIKVSEHHEVNVVSYIQSADYSEIMQMMGFKDQRMFSYPCGNLHAQCVQAFVRMAGRMNTCQGSVPVVPEPLIVNPTHSINNKQRRKKRRKRRKRRRLKRKINRMMKKLHNNMERFDQLEKMPLNDMDARIEVTHDNGEMLHVGSAGPN